MSYYTVQTFRDKLTLKQVQNYAVKDNGCASHDDYDVRVREVNHFLVVIYSFALNSFSLT